MTGEFCEFYTKSKIVICITIIRRFDNLIANLRGGLKFDTIQYNKIKYSFIDDS